MNFDYTYITVFGYPVFEPMIIVTNGILFMLSLRYFSELRRTGSAYHRQMGAFMLMLGISSIFGAIAHSTHYQLGMTFFKITWFMMNATSLVSIYFCFRSSFTLSTDGAPAKKALVYGVIAWIAVLLVFSAIKADFLLIKIHAALVLIYALTAHFLHQRKTASPGSTLVVWGILISFLSIVAHSLKWSVHEWFNYKDIAHVIMIVSLVIIYRGAEKIRLQSTDMASV